MTNNFNDLIKMGVTETRLLLRLKPMDYRMMELEWGDNYDESKMILFKDTITKYYKIAKDSVIIKVGATGLWQFMFATGKMYGLDVSSYVDERSDPIKSTEAASKYLSKLYGI